MNAYDASEQAYKRGYEAGQRDARKKGRWEAYKPESRGYAFGFICSNCCEVTYLDYAQKQCRYNFCPNCGADMRGVEDG